MFPTLLTTVVFSPSLVWSAVLLSPSLLTTSTLPLGPPPGLGSPSNITQLYTNTSSLPSNVLRIQCNSVHYGSNVSPNSCRNVFDFVGRSDENYTYSERHSGRVGDVPLPLRIVSNDGLCFVQPLLTPGMVTGQATGTQIARAAYTLFQRCVVDRGIGGIAVDIGGDNHLNVVISNYSPHIRCDKSGAPGPPLESCLIIGADMVASTDRKVFGDRSRDPRVEVNLPFTYKATDARCQAVVGMTGKSTSASWYEIWEAMTALTAMCVRAHGKGGRAFGMGLRKNIFIQVSDEYPDLSHPTANMADVPGSTVLLGLEASSASSD